MLINQSAGSLDALDQGIESVFKAVPGRQEEDVPCCRESERCRIEGWNKALTGFANEAVGVAMEIHHIFIERRKQLLEVVMIGKCVSQHRETRERGANLGIGGQDLVQRLGGIWDGLCVYC